MARRYTRSALPCLAAVVEHRGGDELLQVARVPPVDLQRFCAAEVELDVVLDREADAAEDLLRHCGDVTERLAREELRHRREPVGPTLIARPRRLPHERPAAVDGALPVGEVMSERL